MFLLTPSALLLPFLTSSARATTDGWDSFIFVTNPNNTATCPGYVYNCNGPDNVCAHDPVLDKWYCCSGVDYPVCRAYRTTCEGSNGGAGSGQILCADGDYDWCCLGGTEVCTQRTGESSGPAVGIIVTFGRRGVGPMGLTDCEMQVKSTSATPPSRTSSRTSAPRP